jgi:hypothetical protein
LADTDTSAYFLCIASLIAAVFPWADSPAVVLFPATPALPAGGQKLEEQLVLLSSLMTGLLSWISLYYPNSIPGSKYSASCAINRPTRRSVFLQELSPVLIFDK